MSAALDLPHAPAPTRPPGLWAQGWHRFRRNKTGMLGLALVSLVVLVAFVDPRLQRFVRAGEGLG